MELLNQNYEPAVPVGTLNLHPQNPRQGDIGLITQSIDTLGFYGALIAQVSSRFILAGNHRFQSAIENGAETIPVIWLDITDDAALRIMLADNRASDSATNDEYALAELLKGLISETGTLDGTAFSAEDLDEIIAASSSPGGAPPDTPPAEKAPPATPGDPGEQRYKEQYAVIVVCTDQPAQEATYNKLMAEGYVCKVVNT